MGVISSRHSVEFKGDAAALAEAIENWAFDNDFHVDAMTSSRVRLKRHRVKLSFLFCFNVLDYPLQVIVKVNGDGSSVKVEAVANMTGALATQGDRRKLGELSGNLAQILASVPSRTDSNSAADDHAPPGDHGQQGAAQQLLEELGVRNRSKSVARH